MHLRLTFYLSLVPSITLPRPSQEQSGNCRLYTGPEVEGGAGEQEQRRKRRKEGDGGTKRGMEKKRRRQRQ